MNEKRERIVMDDVLELTAIDGSVEESICGCVRKHTEGMATTLTE